jgi:hypothetical protein
MRIIEVKLILVPFVKAAAYSFVAETIMVFEFVHNALKGYPESDPSVQDIGLHA